jgi:hypothetical protein
VKNTNNGWGLKVLIVGEEHQQGLMYEAVDVDPNVNCFFYFVQ